MLKYVDTKVTFSEVPNEISLCINISNCPCHCKGCHSPYLAKDIGIPLADWVEYSTEEHSINTPIDKLIETNEGITCVCLMGGDSDTELLNALASEIKAEHNIKVAWYSGRQELSKDINLENFNYIKLGPYIEELGPLNSKTTNQKFYQVCNMASVNEEPRYELIDITYKFQE